jgi:mannose-6-phosphate isomerase-like protein (cupin superfamily)
MADHLPNVVNIADVPEVIESDGGYWASAYKPLTPVLAPRLGRLGVNLTRVPPGKTGCPFHTHQIEDEVFFVLQGKGVLRYGESVNEVKAGV